MEEDYRIARSTYVTKKGKMTSERRKEHIQTLRRAQNKRMAEKAKVDPLRKHKLTKGAARFKAKIEKQKVLK